MSSIYNIKINDLSGKSMDLKQFLGKKLLIVNVASECGLTPQYQQLQELFENNKDQINILACPCNDFGKQESGSPEEIAKFCSTNYKTTFPFTEKVTILESPHPLFLWLCSKDENGLGDFEVEWNFHKFILDESGKLIKSIAATTNPLSDEVLDILLS